VRNIKHYSYKALHIVRLQVYKAGVGNLFSCLCTHKWQAQQYGRVTKIDKLYFDLNKDL